MTFLPGQSGNPVGRDPGSRNKRTIAAEEKLLARADELVDDLVKRALRGEPAAMRLCAERCCPCAAGRCRSTCRRSATSTTRRKRPG
jgi:hypothetical protein